MAPAMVRASVPASVPASVLARRLLRPQRRLGGVAAAPSAAPAAAGRRAAAVLPAAAAAPAAASARRPGWARWRHRRAGRGRRGDGVHVGPRRQVRRRWCRRPQHRLPRGGGCRRAGRGRRGGRHPPPRPRAFREAGGLAEVMDGLGGDRIRRGPWRGGGFGGFGLSPTGGGLAEAVDGLVGRLGFGGRLSAKRRRRAPGGGRLGFGGRLSFGLAARRRAPGGRLGSSRNMGAIWPAAPWGGPIVSKTPLNRRGR